VADERVRRQGRAGLLDRAFSLLYYLSMIVPFFDFITPQWMYVGLTFYIGFGVLTGLVRNDVRLRYGIGHGDIATDLLCGIFAPMFAVSQFEAQMKEPVELAIDEPAADEPAIAAKDAPNAVAEAI